MSRWQKQLDDHQVWNTLGEIRAHLGNSALDAEEDEAEEVKRLLDVVAQVESVLRVLNADFVPFDVLDSFNERLIEHVRNKTHEYSTSKKVSHLQNANDQMTSLLDDLGVLGALGAEPTQRIRSEFETRINEFIGQQNDLYSRQIIEMSNSMKEKTDSAIEEMDEILSGAKDKRDKILDLYEIVAGDSATSGYARNASEEGRLANIWRRCSVGFIVSTSAWLLCFILYTIFGGKGEISWSIYPLAISLTGVLLFGAVFSGQQSSRHRNNEQKFRRLALRVAAFEPFVASLDDDVKNELRKEIAATIFGGDDQSEADNDEISLPLSAYAEIAKIFERFTRK